MYDYKNPDLRVVLSYKYIFMNLPELAAWLAISSMGFANNHEISHESISVLGIIRCTFTTLLIHIARVSLQCLPLLSQCKMFLYACIRLHQTTTCTRSSSVYSMKMAKQINKHIWCNTVTLKRITDYTYPKSIP